MILLPAAIVLIVFLVVLGALIRAHRRPEDDDVAVLESGFSHLRDR